jgi:two-component system chemotaxis response regulator CheY
MSELNGDVHFLVVDDLDSIRGIFKNSLGQLKLDKNYHDASNVAAAKSIMETQFGLESPIQFIICDWEMPGESGLDFLKWVRANEDFAKVPFLMVTTINAKDKVLSAIGAGANSYLIKPFSFADFKDKITTIWEIIP